MKGTILALSIGVFLVGCEGGGIFTKAAGYSLTRTPDGGCNIQVVSERDLNGMMVEVDGTECSVNATADMQQRATLQALQMGTLAVQGLLQMTPGSRALVPAPGQELSDEPIE